MARPEWHVEDIKAAIRKTGVTLVGLSLRSGLERSAVGQALLRPWPNVERVIANHLGLRPQDIWPSRYDESGNPLRGGWTQTNHSPRRIAEHRQKGKAA